MLANIFTVFLGILFFLFIFWKRLKEDYVSEIIFKIATYILVGILVSYLLSLKYFPSWFMWTSFVGGILGLIFGIFTLTVKFYEALEAFVISFLPWIALMFLGNSVVNSSLSSFLAFGATLIIIFVSYWFGDNYKNFTWYKSGKIGFAGPATCVIIFLTRFIVAIFGIHVLSFVSSRYEAILSGALAIVSLGLLINLSRNDK